MQSAPLIMHKLDAALALFMAKGLYGETSFQRVHDEMKHFMYEREADVPAQCSHTQYARVNMPIIAGAINQWYKNRLVRDLEVSLKNMDYGCGPESPMWRSDIQWWITACGNALYILLTGLRQVYVSGDHCRCIDGHCGSVLWYAMDAARKTVHAIMLTTDEGWSDLPRIIQTAFKYACADPDPHTEIHGTLAAHVCSWVRALECAAIGACPMKMFGMPRYRLEDIVPNLVAIVRDGIRADTAYRPTSVEDAARWGASVCRVARSMCDALKSTQADALEKIVRSECTRRFS